MPVREDGHSFLSRKLVVYFTQYYSEAWKNSIACVNAILLLCSCKDIVILLCPYPTPVIRIEERERNRGR